MEPAKKINITLTAEMARAVRASVEAGEYASIDDALCDAVRVWRRERAEHAERIAVIRARIRSSIDDPSPRLSIEEVRAELDALHAETVRAEVQGTSRTRNPD